MARRAVRRAQQHLAGEAVQPLGEAVALGVGLPGDDARVLEGAEDAEHRGLGQLDRLGDLGELGGTLVVAEGLEDPDGAKDR